MLRKGKGGVSMKKAVMALLILLTVGLIPTNVYGEDDILLDHNDDILYDDDDDILSTKDIVIADEPIDIANPISSTAPVVVAPESTPVSILKPVATQVLPQATSANTPSLIVVHRVLSRFMNIVPQAVTI